MRITFKKVVAGIALTAIAAVSSVSFASAKQGSPDIGLWYYSEGGIIVGDCYSKFSPQGEGETTWHSATVINSKKKKDKDTKYDDGEWAKATVAWTFGTDCCYYDHD